MVKTISYCVLSSFLWVFSLFLIFFWLYSKILALSGCAVMGIDLGDGFSFLVNVMMVLDSVSTVFSCVVLFISSCVLLYCGFYMSHEKFIERFIGLMILFVLSMNLLVLFPSLLFMMVGWDGLGVTSFLLVIYYMNSSSLAAGMITALTNRLGDAVFIVVLGGASFFYGYDFLSLKMFSVMFFLFFFLLVGSMTKSAQVPFSAWLPAAMAAPTPVSSLVHSSTLVTAGVYVMIRFSSLLSSFISFSLVIFSMLTIIMAGLSALGEVDVKKVVALSTLSQVGVMMLCLGLGLPDVALFHLLVHAFFKALMFMCVGSVIFSSGGIQDVRYLGGLWFKSPVVFCWLLVSILSLTGVPFFSGFYSKDLIMEEWMSGSLSVVSIFFIMLSIYLTSFYGMRMLVLLSRFDESFSYRCYGENSVYLLLSLFLMGIGAFWGGYFLQGMALAFNDFVYVGFVEKICLLFSVFFGMVVFIIFTSLYFEFIKEMPNFISLMKFFMGDMWFLPPLSGNFVSGVFLSLCVSVISYLEKGWVSFLWSLVFFGLGEGSKSSRGVQFNTFGFLLAVGMVFSFFVLSMW